MSGVGESGGGSNALRRPRLKKHTCTLGLGSESMLPKSEDSFNPCRTLKKLTLIAMTHPLSFRYFISYTAILAERQRQIIKAGPCIIHPYSVISFVWSILMVIVYLSTMNLIPFRFAFVMQIQGNHPLDHVILTLNMIGLLDIIVKFNTGYPLGKPYNIVFSRKKIALHYLCTWLVPDLLSCLPLSYIGMAMGLPHRVIMLFSTLKMIRYLRIITVIIDLKMITKAITSSCIWQRCVRHVTLFACMMHWCVCAVYFPVMINYHWYGVPPTGYCQFLGQNQVLSDIPMYIRYKKGMFIGFSAFLGSGYSRFISKNWDEVLASVFVVLFSSMFMVYNLVFFLKLYLTIYSSTVRYQELMNQVEKYMRHKQFPAQLKKRVREFYNYRYQHRYFKEECTLGCLSEQLRNEISLHTCHKLIEGVPLFEGLPASVVGAVLGCLKPEVFMTNDLIIRANDIGTCMYFIATGTVAVYSMKGVEVCHLGDGSHFGEVALLMKDRKRVATVVAVEITQVYRINANDFHDFVISYHELYERIEALASKRMHETVLIDEEFRKANRNASSLGFTSAQTSSLAHLGGRSPSK